VSVAGLAKRRRLRFYLANQVECVEDDRFGQGNRQDRVHEDRCKCAWVATNRGGHALSGVANANSNTHGGEADVNASVNFCQ
jgi:hypothetical protein